MKKLPLNDGKFAFVDDADFEHVSQFRWHTKPGTNTEYAIRAYRLPKVSKGVYGRTIHVILHREILRNENIDGKIIDHKDRNGLNCTRANLRICNKSQNAQNRNADRNSSSRFLGVSYSNRVLEYNSKKWGPRKYDCSGWCAYIKYDGKNYNLGKYKATTTELGQAKAVHFTL